MNARWFAFEYPPFPSEAAKPGSAKSGPIFVHLVVKELIACGASRQVLKAVTLTAEPRGFMPTCCACLAISEGTP